MDDALAIGTHCGSLDGTVTLNIQIKNGMNCFGIAWFLWQNIEMKMFMVYNCLHNENIAFLLVNYKIILSFLRFKSIPFITKYYFNQYFESI